MLLLLLQEGGHAIADILLGKVSPSGRLPNTWYTKPYTDKISMLDMHMRPDPSRDYPGRSHRFIPEGSPYVLYPFGYGLSYSKFEYVSLEVTCPQRGREGGSMGCSKQAKTTSKGCCCNCTKHIHNTRNAGNSAGAGGGGGGGGGGVESPRHEVSVCRDCKKGFWPGTWKSSRLKSLLNMIGLAGYVCGDNAPGDGCSTSFARVLLQCMGKGWVGRWGWVAGSRGAAPALDASAADGCNGTEPATAAGGVGGSELLPMLCVDPMVAMDIVKQDGGVFAMKGSNSCCCGGAKNSDKCFGRCATWGSSRGCGDSGGGGCGGSSSGNGISSSRGGGSGGSSSTTTSRSSSARFSHTSSSSSQDISSTTRLNTCAASVKVKNTGLYPASQSVLLYVSHTAAVAPGFEGLGLPLRELRGTAHTPILQPGQTSVVKFDLSVEDFKVAVAEAALVPGFSNDVSSDEDASSGVEGRDDCEGNETGIGEVEVVDHGTRGVLNSGSSRSSSSEGNRTSSSSSSMGGEHWAEQLQHAGQHQERSERCREQRRVGGHKGERGGGGGDGATGGFGVESGVEGYLRVGAALNGVLKGVWEVKVGDLKQRLLVGSHHACQKSVDI